MTRDEMVEALGTIARSGTKAFMDRVGAAQGAEGTQLIGQFGVGFYSAFMVADRVEVASRRAGQEDAAVWSSMGRARTRCGRRRLARHPSAGRASPCT
jgi:molecular chaperone HtpG